MHSIYCLFVFVLSTSHINFRILWSLNGRCVPSQLTGDREDDPHPNNKLTQLLLLVWYIPKHETTSPFDCVACSWLHTVTNVLSLKLQSYNRTKNAHWIERTSSHHKWISSSGRCTPEPDDKHVAVCYITVSDLPEPPSLQLLVSARKGVGLLLM